jgi:hypothetical protein
MRRLEMLVIMFSFYAMHINAMESEVEVHPFMLFKVDQSLQAIKDQHRYGIFRDENAPEVQAARAMFDDSQEAWTYGTWDDGVRWKSNRRCGLGLIELLSGDKQMGTMLIAAAVRKDKSAWAHYYIGLLTLVVGGMKDPISAAFEHFKQAHEKSPHIPSHWYRHIMAVTGWKVDDWKAEPKQNWMIWFDRQLCGEYRDELGYPLAVYARACRDEVGAELLCLQMAARYPNKYQDDALRGLYEYSTKIEHGAPHPYAQRAEELLREKASQVDGYFARTLIEDLNKLRKQKTVDTKIQDSDDERS